MFRKTKRQLVRIGKRGGKNAAAAREELKRRGLMPDGSRER
jgi:hypothetical protein